jgi:threonine dehydratase
MVPLGNGALLGGIATWMKAHSPHTRVIGVCASGAPSMAQSFRLNRVVETSSAETIADGIAVRVPIPEAVEDLRGIVDDVVLVDDSETLAAMRLLRECEGMEVEPGAAVGLAAIASRAAELSGRLVGTVLTGANLTDEQRTQWF